MSACGFFSSNPSVALLSFPIVSIKISICKYKFTPFNHIPSMPTSHQFHTISTMSSDLPIRQEVFQEYFGETDWIKCLEICDARKDPNKSYYIVSDLTCDTSLCPYRAEGPFETPIPTLAEVVAAYDRSKSGPWRVGPYMVRVGNGADILRVIFTSIHIVGLEFDLLSGSREPNLFREKLKRSSS